MSPTAYRHYAWPVSPYSAKTRAYLRYKALPFEEIQPSALHLASAIKGAVGRMVMPTLLTPQGTWLQDSSEIIDTLERMHPELSITPEGPTQRLASSLLELHGDEWLPIVAMHTRWNVPQNTRFAEEEFGRYAFPWLPLFIAKRLARPFAQKMRGYRPSLGITDETRAGIERFAKSLIAQLESHFSDGYEFLFGGRPSLGDFSLYGPLWAHVYRDPGTSAWFDEAPNVVAWFKRLQSQPHPERSDFLSDDHVPETLDPIFRTLFSEQFSFITRLVDAIERYCVQHPQATRVPRSLGVTPFVIGGDQGVRKLITFTQWMAQRPLDIYHSLAPSTRVEVDLWLERVGGREAMQLRIKHRFARRDFKMGLETAPHGV